MSAEIVDPVTVSDMKTHTDNNNMEIPKDIEQALLQNEALLEEWAKETRFGRDLLNWDRVGTLTGLAMGAALGQEGCYQRRDGRSKVTVMDEQENWVVQVFLNASDLFDVLVVRLVELGPGEGAALVVAKLPDVFVGDLQARVFGAIENALEKGYGDD